MGTEAWIAAAGAVFGVLATITVAVVRWMLAVTYALTTVTTELREFRQANVGVAIDLARGCHDRHRSIENLLENHEERIVTLEVVRCPDAR